MAATDIEDRKQAEDRLRQENVALREEIDKTSMFEEIVGTSPALKRRTFAHVQGCSQAIPRFSSPVKPEPAKNSLPAPSTGARGRSSRAFVSVNCAAIPRDLIASELFGHEKGAFTGATATARGQV